jgi:hypothetical protein
MGAERWYWCALLLLLGCAAQAQRFTQRPVDVHANNVRLSEALLLIAHDGGFKLSYNAAAIKGDSLVNVQVNGTAEKALRGLLGDRMRFMESGEHVILVEDANAQALVTVRGRVVDAKSGAAIPRASVYATRERVTTSTGGDGSFKLEVTAQKGGSGLLIARSGYSDTVVYVRRDQPPIEVPLLPRERIAYLEPRCVYDRCLVEDLGAARLLVSSAQMDAAANLSLSEERAIQFSVWPGVGTNGAVGGAIVNHASFNLFAGYAKGVDGAEVGVGANVIRRDVKGLQFAGLANLVGRDTKGVQFAGGLNHTMGSLDGLQFAGFGNTVWDTLNGVQIAGGANVVKGGMRGLQISGGGNVTTQSCDGTQISGGFNVTVREVRKAQVAGGFNYGRQIKGAQVAGGFNAAFGSVGGGQVAGGFNIARQVTGGQVAGGMNVVIDTVFGGQVGVFNFARVSAGGQLGIINLSDTITGASIGLLSIARRGYHRFDVSATDVLPLTLALRTGTARFYNMISWSAPVDADERWGFGYGLGTEPRLGKHGALNIELSAEHVNERAEWIDAVNILGRFSLQYTYTFGRHVLLSAGPSLSVLTSDWRSTETGEYLSSIAADDLLLDEIRGDQQVQGWLGWRAGLGVRF